MRLNIKTFSYRRPSCREENGTRVLVVAVKKRQRANLLLSAFIAFSNVQIKGGRNTHQTQNTSHTTNRVIKCLEPCVVHLSTTKNFNREMI